MLNIAKSLRGISVMAAALIITTAAHAATIKTLGPVYPGTVSGIVTYSTDETLIFKFAVGASYNFMFQATGAGGNFVNEVTITATGTPGDYTEVFGPISAQGLVDYSLTTFPNTSTPSSVPEPATWAMMLAGMGAVGFAMRRRNRMVTV